MITLVWWQFCLCLFLYYFFVKYIVDPILDKLYSSWKKRVIKERRRKINTRKYW